MTRLAANKIVIQTTQVNVVEKAHLVRRYMAVNKNSGSNPGSFNETILDSSCTSFCFNSLFLRLRSGFACPLDSDLSNPFR